MEFDRIIQTHKRIYPLMTPQDFGKLSYQSEFGPRHLGLEYEKAFQWIRNEWNEAVKENYSEAAEYIGNGLYRCHFWKNADEDARELFTKLFLLTGQAEKGTVDGLKERLKKAVDLGTEGMAEWILEYEKSGFPAVSHSEIFRENYHPHYRLIQKDYIIWFPVLLKIHKLMKEKERIVISIDGNCGSGKTTLASVAKKVFGASVFHMDDYYLPVPHRRPDWREIPAGNMDLSRFRGEVLEAVKAGKNVTYQPFDCQMKSLKESSIVEIGNLVIVEGSYSQHPDLAPYYDLKIFLTCSKEEQKKRLLVREGDYYSVFESCWIPLEEKYHEAFDIKEKADYLFETGERK